MIVGKELRVICGVVSVVLVAVTTFVTAAAAQPTTGAIDVTVFDSTGAPLAGAAVRVRHVETGVERQVTTGTDGRAVAAGLAVGRYEVRATHPRFTRTGFSPVEVVVGQTVITGILLEQGDALVVHANPTDMNTTSSELSYLVGEKSIEQLPLNGRNYTDLAALQPGVSPYSHRDGGSVVAHGLAMSVNGQDPRSNVYLLDGTLQNDFTNGPAGSGASTALGTETVHEFRVEANAYSAEFGRNSGGQIRVVTKSGTNDVSGSAYEFHRNDALDARNFFDRGGKPDFTRNQYGGTIGGPLKENRTFFFVGYEALRERLGKTISTVVPDENARLGILPGGPPVPINAAVRPYLLEFPQANGALLGGGLAEYTFGFEQTIDQHFVNGRIDHHLGSNHQFFGRYTFDTADQALPTDYPQFPRAFLSRNQFFTGEYRNVLSERTLQTFRLGFSRTRIGQNVEANTSQPLPVFVAGRPMMGDIDIGGLKRFGPQSSANLRLVQNVFSGQYDVTHVRGPHLLKAGGLAEHYQDNMVNPTFSLGIYRFANLRNFLLDVPANFVGLTPEGAIDRYWRFTLFGLYVQDEFRISPRVTLNGGLRYEFSTLPEEKYNRDSALLDPLSDPAPVVGPLYENPTYTNLSPRGGLAWDVTGDGRTSVRAGYGLYFNTNNQQNLIVTVSNPPFTPRAVIANPTFPSPPFERAGSLSIRPVQWDLDNPRVHVWNASIQRQIAWHIVVTAGYAASRGTHLLRSNDVNVPTPTTLDGGTPFFPPNTPRPNRAFSTIELKSSDGDSWYKALILDVRRRWSHGWTFQSSYTRSRSEDTTQASTFFSDATNGTTSAFPEFIPDYNRGRSDFDARHQWVASVTWALPFAERRTGVAGALLSGWNLSGIVQRRSGNPLTVFVTGNRSRSLWTPSLGPGIGQDRPSYAPGYDSERAVMGLPDQWFDPAAFALQPAGTFGNTGRGDFDGPDLRTVDLALVKTARLARPGDDARVEIRIEAFNIFNRANFGAPALSVFSGTADNEAPLSTFGRITTTTTSARQVQLGVKIIF